MKRAGFTMIELIFVIVILGILAAVAVPKLAATRDDATVSKIASNVSSSIKNVGARYVASGAFDADLSAYISGDFNPSDADCSDGCTLSFVDDNNNSCVTAAVTTDGNITIANGANSGVVCSGVQGALADSIGTTLQFGGSGVTY